MVDGTEAKIMAGIGTVPWYSTMSFHAQLITVTLSQLLRHCRD